MTIKCDRDPTGTKWTVTVLSGDYILSQSTRKMLKDAVSSAVGKVGGLELKTIALGMHNAGLINVLGR